MEITNRIFSLQSYGRADPQFRSVVLLPENTQDDIKSVQAAWSYALRYTAKGLDLPDHDAALQLLRERHPSWEIVPGICQPVTVDLTKADDDIPEDQS